MIEGYEEARGEIEKAVAHDLDCFTPPKKDTYLGPEVLTTFATLLLYAFLAGFIRAAKKKIDKLGEEVFNYLWEAITDLFSEKEESAAKEELKKKASDDPSFAKNLTEDELTCLSEKVKMELKKVLRKKLDEDQAEKMAESVRKSVLTHIVKGRKK